MQLKDSCEFELWGYHSRLPMLYSIQHAIWCELRGVISYCMSLTGAVLITVQA